MENIMSWTSWQDSNVPRKYHSRLLKTTWKNNSRGIIHVLFRARIIEIFANCGLGINASDLSQLDYRIFFRLQVSNTI